jgi:hypothetical protein
LNCIIASISKSSSDITTHTSTPPSINNVSLQTPQSHTLNTAKMVKLEEVMDEEFQREQDGPHDDDEWDTDSGTQHA